MFWRVYFEGALDIGLFQGGKWLEKYNEHIAKFDISWDISTPVFLREYYFVRNAIFFREKTNETEA